MIDVGEAFGIPIVHDGALKTYARAAGIWPFKRIILGRNVDRLSPRTQWALILHEVKHCLAGHYELRLLLIPFYWTGWAQRITHRQELAADAFAVACGYGVDFLRLFRPAPGYDEGQNPFYPNHAG